MHRSRKLRVLVVAALIGGLLLVGSAEDPAAAAPPNPPTSPSASVSGSTATISWTAPSPLPLFYAVVATDTTTSSYFGESWAAASTTSVEWPALLAGHSYSFDITAVNLTGSTREDSTAATATASVPAAGCNGIADPCMAVDATSVGDPNTFIGSGLLSGVDSTSSPNYASYVEPLNIKQWRLDGSGVTTGQAAAFGYILNNGMSVSTTSIVSNAWYQHTQIPANKVLSCTLQPIPRAPWDGNWTYYQVWLTNYVNGEIAAGREPDYWDIMNEPGFGSIPYWTTVNRLEDVLCPNRITEARLEELIRRTTIILHNLGQRVIVPSWSDWNYKAALGDGVTDPYLPGGSPFRAVLNLNHLLAYGDTAGITFDGISWHELGDPWGMVLDETYYRGTPRTSITNASQVRALIGSHASASGAELFINEYSGGGTVGGSPGGYTPAGKVAGWLFGVTASGVTQANRSCAIVADCSNGMLDALLMADGSGTHKRDAWYVYEFYGQMAGDLVETASTDSTFTGVSAYDSTNGALRILLGRHDNNSVRADADATVEVTTPVAFGSSVAVTISVMGGGSNNGSGPSAGPTVSHCDATVNSSGIAEIPLDDFPDNYSYGLTIEPAGAPQTAC